MELGVGNEEGVGEGGVGENFKKWGVGNIEGSS